MNYIIISLGQNLAYPHISSRSSSAYQTLFWGNGIGHCTVTYKWYSGLTLMSTTTSLTFRGVVGC